MEELPLGYRFYPTEEELISFYLHHKLHGDGPDVDSLIPIVDIYSHEPEHLPNLAGEKCRGESEQWFFFMPQQERELRGGRPNRTTSSGYWKATGSPSYVYSSSNRVIAVKKTMVFYKGKAPIGRKTKWKMNEYKAIKVEDSLSGTGIPQLRHEFSVCRVYVTSGCSRAFDRRPAASTATMSNQIQGEGSALTISENVAAVNKSGSTDSPSSGGEDYVEPLAADGAGNSTSYDQMADDLEPLWELEQLNWL